MARATKKSLLKKLAKIQERIRVEQKKEELRKRKHELTSQRNHEESRSESI